MIEVAKRIRQRLAALNNCRERIDIIHDCAEGMNREHLGVLQHVGVHVQLVGELRALPDVLKDQLCMVEQLRQFGGECTGFGALRVLDRNCQEHQNHCYFAHTNSSISARFSVTRSSRDW